LDKYLDVIRKTLQLSETILEGLAYIQANLDLGEFEKTKTMFTDVIEGIYQIQQSISAFLSELPANEIAALNGRLKNSLDGVVTAYEQKEAAQLKEKMEEELLPVFQKWQEELSRCLRPYLLNN